MKALLARLKRGYARMWAWVVAKLQGARGYRYDGEEEHHEQVLRETRTMLSMMESAAGDVERERMATDIEDGAEAQLSVLLQKPRLTLAEKRTRDAIQAALQQRRQSFDGSPAPQPAIRGFMGAAAQANPLAAVLMSPMTWLAAGLAITMGWGTLTTWRLNNAKGDLREVRADLAAAERSLAEAAAINEHLAEAMRAADAQTRQTAANIEAERARRVRTERELRRIRDAMAAARDDGPIDYGFGGVRDDEQVPGAGGDSSAGAGRSR